MCAAVTPDAAVEAIEVTQKQKKMPQPPEDTDPKEVAPLTDDEYMA